MGSFINGDGRLVNDKVVEDGGEGVMLMMAREIEGEELDFVYFSFVQWRRDIGGRKQDVSFSNITQIQQTSYTNTTSVMFMPKYSSIGAYLLELLLVVLGLLVQVCDPLCLSCFYSFLPSSHFLLSPLLLVIVCYPLHFEMVKSSCASKLPVLGSCPLFKLLSLLFSFESSSHVIISLPAKGFLHLSHPATL